MVKVYFLFIAFLSGHLFANAKDFELSSPSGKQVIKIQVDSTVRFSVLNNGVAILSIHDLGMELDAARLGRNTKVEKTRRSTSRNTIEVPVPVKFSTIIDHYTQLELICRGGYSIVFRAYDNGVAYRFVTRLPSSTVIVNAEQLSFSVKDARNTIWPYEYNRQAAPMQSHFEYLFKNIPYDSIDKTTVGLPLYFTGSNGAKIVFTESDLFDYPNLFVQKNNTLKATFPHPILEQQRVGDRGVRIIKEADHIASTTGARSFPWRVWMIAENDSALLTNTLVYQLATPTRIGNTSWIRPGKVAWDWWNANNIYGVDFKSGINNNTYKYYIDFAAQFNLPYIILDEGWTKTTLDLLNPAPDINVPELVAYGRQKNVGVILWVLWNPLDEKMDEVLDLYKSWGVKGIKVDFMTRAEQYMVNFYTRTAEACAKRELLVDFHGAYKPTGLERTYPNAISFEGVHGLENTKWEATITPQHDATLPFTRMMAGPMDYTPGAMKNATRRNFHSVFSEPMSMGTRAHQAALYVVFESPLQMLADNPSLYLEEPEYARYLSRFPTTWNDTRVLYAEAGKAVIIARRQGASWYIGGITDWNGFTREIALDFLGSGAWEAEILEDGINASKAARDHKMSKRTVDGSTRLSITMAPGGGFTAILSPK
jgi:alpha-glucosidase